MTATTCIRDHECTGIDCERCTTVEREAVEARYAALRATLLTPKFAKPRAKRSVALSARPASARTVNHVAGDVSVTYRRVLPGEATFEQIEAIRASGNWACDSEDHNGSDGCSNPECFKFSDRSSTPPPAAAENPAGGPAHELSLDLPPEGRLSDVTVAKGFILAGNAYFTVRSAKTGTRYTYRVSRADCSRCGKKNCQCWRFPTYFVALLTGPDNTGDYTYLGMLRDNAFRLTRGSKMLDSSGPVKAFRWVWDHLTRDAMPPFCEIWHEGRCGRCGRTLTVPESIAAGIGPDCAGKL